MEESYFNFYKILNLDFGIYESKNDFLSSGTIVSCMKKGQLFTFRSHI